MQVALTRRLGCFADGHGCPVPLQLGDLSGYPSDASENSRFLQGHLQRRGSIEAESSLLLFQKLFQTDANFFVIEHFAALDLRESFFDLADEPLVVPQQAFDRFANKGLRVSALLFRYALQLGLKFRREIDFHMVSLLARSDKGQEFDIIRYQWMA